MGFEPTRGDPNGLAVHRLNHSATSSSCLFKLIDNLCSLFPLCFCMVVQEIHDCTVVL